MKLAKTRVLVTGSSGRLGKELVSLLEAEGAVLSTPSSQEWDITKDLFCKSPWHRLELVIHCAAYTDVPGAEKNKGGAVDVNIIGTCNVAKFARAHNAKLVYISSDYVTYRPMGMYAFTKLAGESFARPTDMIIRTSFKSRGTWGLEALTKVFHPVYTNADWTDIIAEQIVKAIKKDLTGIVAIGTERKTLKELAKQEFKEVGEIPVENADKLLGYHYPRDCCVEITI
jgi:dTDP-4-dehydrorhamnose reductase